MLDSIKYLALSFFALHVLQARSQSNTTCGTGDICVTETILLRPSGPIKRRTWIDNNSADPIRIEYEGITSGNYIIDNYRLIHCPDGSWIVEAPDRLSFTLLSANDTLPTHSIIYVTHERWLLSITRRQTPRVQTGIATESVHSIDLILERQ